VSEPEPDIKWKLGYLGYTKGTSHTGVPLKEGKRDVRFAPMQIVLRKEWKKPGYGYYGKVIDMIAGLDPKAFPDIAIGAAPVYLYERTCRRYLNKALLSDELMATLEAHLVARYDKMNQPQRCIMKLNDAGGFDVDLTVASGPFYMEAALAIEHNHPDKLTPLQPGARWT